MAARDLQGDHTNIDPPYVPQSCRLATCETFLKIPTHLLAFSPFGCAPSALGSSSTKTAHAVKCKAIRTPLLPFQNHCRMRPDPSYYPIANELHLSRERELFMVGEIAWCRKGLSRSTLDQQAATLFARQQHFVHHSHIRSLLALQVQYEGSSISLNINYRIISALRIQYR